MLDRGRPTPYLRVHEIKAARGVASSEHRPLAAKKSKKSERKPPVLRIGAGCKVELVAREETVSDWEGEEDKGHNGQRPCSRDGGRLLRKHASQMGKTASR